MHTDGDYYIGTKGNSKRVIFSDREAAPIAVITADPRPAAVSDANARLLVNANRMFKLLNVFILDGGDKHGVYLDVAKEIVKEIEGA